jgi:hypothetical protein
MSKSSDLYPKKRVGVIKYTSIYLNKDHRTITYQDVDEFKLYVSDQIHIMNLSPNQIAKQLGITHKNFGTFIKSCLGITLKDVRSAVINTKRQMGTLLTDDKSLFYKQCEFDLSQREMTQIPGFNLVIKHGMYHPVNNPNGAVRDHILSRAEAYQKRYDPSHIRHPANCQFITNLENIKKNCHSDITYEQLLERISLWERHVVPKLVTERRVIDKSPERIDNIRKGVIARLDKIKSGEIASSMGKMGGRPASFHKKYDWTAINKDIDMGLTRSQICEKIGASPHDLAKAKRLGLITK